MQTVLQTKQIDLEVNQLSILSENPGNSWPEYTTK